MEITATKTRYHKYALSFEYTSDRVDFCRVLKDAYGWQNFSFHQEKKVWVFSNEAIIHAIVAKYPQTRVERAVVDECETIRVESIENQKIAEDVAEIKAGRESTIEIPGLKGDMFPYQKLGVEFLVRNNGNALLADTQGLGKSIQYIGFLLTKNPSRALIVCPASMKYTWEAEVKKWSDLNPFVIESKTDIPSIPPEHRVWVINYDILIKHAPALLRAEIEAVGFDEAHYLKNTKAQRTKAAMLLAKHIPSTTLLTGTPVLSRPVEIFTLLRMIDPKTWANYRDFTKRYCDGKQGRFGYEAKGATNIEELRERMSRYYLRRTKEEVLKELPPKLRIPIPVEMPAEYAKQYDKASRDLKNFLKENKGKKDPEVRAAMQAERLVQLNILREITAMGSVDAVTEMVQNIVDAGEKVIVFSCFKFPLEAMRQKFPNNSVMLTGDTPLADRADMVQQFQNDPETQIFFGGIKSAGVGLTLTAAANVIFLDYSWTPADHMQAEDRAHRIGSAHQSINIYQMIPRGTIAGFMRELVLSKQLVFDRLIENPVETADELFVSDEKQKTMMKEVLRFIAQQEEEID